MRVRKAKAKSKKSTGKIASSGPREKSIAEQVRMAEQEQAVFLGKIRGITNVALAKQLNVTPRTIQNIFARVFEEYMGDHRQEQKRALVVAKARLEAIIAGNWNETIGATVRTKDGKEITYKKDPVVGNLVLRAQRELDRINGLGLNISIEHVGAGGGPIQTQQVEASPAEAARLVREMFAGKVKPYQGPMLPPKPIVVHAEEVKDDDSGTTH